MAKMLNCPNCGVASEIGDPHFKALGREVNKLQSRVHRQRVAHKELKAKYRQLFIEHDRRLKLIDEARHAVASARDQAQRMTASMRVGALHGLAIPEGEDRQEAMALIIQNLRLKNMEQYRALTALTAAAEYLALGLRLENEDGPPETSTVARELLAAIEGALSVIAGDKSNLTKELERQQTHDINYAANVKTMATRWLTNLLNIRGPVRKRDLKAAIETIAKV